MILGMPCSTDKKDFDYFDVHKTLSYNCLYNFIIR